MAFHRGPKIVTNGLVLMLDAANTKSLTPGENTAKNLVSKELVTGANGTPYESVHSPDPANFPEHNSLWGGVFDFAGGRGMNCKEDLGSFSELSLNMWLYKKSGDGQYITDARNNGGEWFLSNYQSNNISYYNTLTYNFDYPHVSSSTGFTNKWIHLVIASDSTNSKLWVNGVLLKTDPPIPHTLGKNFRIGTRYTTTGTAWTGYMGPIMAYSKKLTDSEVKQNFRATRSRFGV